MKTQHLDLQTPDGTCDAYVAHPDGAGPFPAVLFYMDAYGLRPYLFEMVNTLAERGYLVFAPNVFYRQSRSPVIEADFPLTAATFPSAHAQLMTLMKEFDPAQALRDAGVYLEHLARDSRVRPGPIGIVGYCLGGSLAVRTAAAYPERVAVAASFHGGNLATAAPNSPHLALKDVTAELYFGLAENDASLPPEQIVRLHQALDSARLEYELETYPGTTHGFTMADLPPGNAAAIKRHWDSLGSVLKRRLNP